MAETLFGLLGGFIGSVLVYLGVRFTARQSVKAATVTAKVSDRQVNVNEWQAIVQELRKEVERLTERVDALEGQRLTDRTQIERMERELSVRDARQRTLVSYLREVLAWARHYLPDQTPPPAPASIADDLAG